jgi:hypothetical protein
MGRCRIGLATDQHRSKRLPPNDLGVVRFPTMMLGSDKPRSTGSSSGCGRGRPTAVFRFKSFDEAACGAGDEPIAYQITRRMRAKVSLFQRIE